MLSQSPSLHQTTQPSGLVSSFMLAYELLRFKKLKHSRDQISPLAQQKTLVS